MAILRVICIILLVGVSFMPWDPTSKFIFSMIVGLPFIWDFGVYVTKRFSGKGKS
jgi:hypothetical protein